MLILVHFNWTQLIPQVGHHYIHVATFAATSGLILVLGLVARAQLGSGEKAITPAAKLSVRAFFETITEFIVNLTVMVVGEKGKKFAPMFATIFSIILLNNLVGLLPGMTPATDNMNTTMALGFLTFIIYNYSGFKEHGISYLKQFLGPLLALAPLMLLIEIISHLVRPLSLGLRLQGNMMGDHTVLGIFLDLVPYVLPVIFYALGMFVCFMQAFVFTMLSMIYVSMAISHDH
ncbi:F0F1 ATP synthase subunit A [bacterium]|nr:F0F1 ATP synthase subunit A [bacterium]